MCSPFAPAWQVFFAKKFPARHFPLPACPSGPGRLALRLSMRYTARHTLNARIRLMQDNFSHLDKDGNITMVDVGAKPDTRRVAIAEAIVELSPHTPEAAQGMRPCPRATC